MKFIVHYIATGYFVAHVTQNATLKEYFCLHTFALKQ